MRLNRAILVLSALSFAAAGCGESSEAQKANGSPCAENAECRSNLCVNGTCIAPCSVSSCGAGEICAPSGLCVSAVCSDSAPCADAQKVCSNGQCIVPECSDAAPCADEGKVCREYRCYSPECSDTAPCGGGKICENGYCVDPECSDTAPCGGIKICENGKCIDPECSDSAPCDGGKICEDGKCVYECTAAKPCADSSEVCVSGKCLAECDDDRPCGDSLRTCLNGRCVVLPEDACAKGTCPEGKVCGEDGACFDGACSVIDACDDGLFCQNLSCVSRDKVVCYADGDCGSGYACDNKKCVPETSCSMTRTCAGGLVCHNGVCAAPVSAPCSKTKACPDDAQTCVEGQCITCACKDGESCAADGSCFGAKTSDSGKVSVGDDCVWATFAPHCDRNRRFSCVDGKVSMTDCGAKICANAPEEGLGCYEPCENDGDFYGECIGWTDIIQFTRVCSDTSDGKRVWSLQKGYKDCSSGCSNGRCNFVPEEFGGQCSEQSYPDACQGDWLTYCYSGYMAGTDCKTYSAAHFCALPSENAQKLYNALDPSSKLIGACAEACAESGKTRFECLRDSEGNVVSMRYLCATATDGKLADFEAGYTQCTVGCNAETGLCI